MQTRIDRRSYSLSDDLQAKTGSIGDALGNLPSVEVDPDGKLSLRGDANVTILVDGKPSGLFKGAGRAAALQQLPADRYARVEIITNPSAAFDANGSGGVINLISKKAKGAGITGSLQANVGDQGLANGAGNVGYNSSRLSLNGDLSVRRNILKKRTREHRDLAGDVESDGVYQGRTSASFSNLHLSAQYEVGERTQLSADAHHLRLDWVTREADAFEIRSPGREISSTRVGRKTYRVYDDGIEAQLVRKFAGEDHDLTLDLDHGAITNKDRQPYAYLAGAPETGAYQAMDFDQRQTLTRLSADYRKPLPEGAKLTAGVQVEDDGYLYENSGARGADAATARPDPSLTNRFRYGQVVSAAYATLERPFGKLTALMGLRVESARIKTEQLTLGGTHRDTDTRAFPSLHLSYALDDRRQVKGSYTQRLERPDPDDLNPFPNTAGALTVTAGNPALKPEETRGVEASYEYRDGPAYHLATVFYRDIRDTVTDIVTPLEGGTLLSTKQNLGRKRNVGLELSVGGRLTSKLTYTASTTATYSEIEAEGLTGEKTRSALLVGGKGSLNCQITSADLFQLNAQLRAKRLTPQGYAPAYSTLNLGFRHKIDERLSLVATARDVLNTSQTREYVTQSGLRQRVDYDNNSRRFTLGLSYALGGKSKKPSNFDYGG
ncbi:outer membrane beta-barrel family protein [Caulobacter sp.]|uniref:outer membrane beta-barrel family protein n=1 Tax=Caulobacter sp. TaxID=78 RepID=UPI001B2B77C9|nr:outer membrane beta-barrel family protein [Caulobacter sp.]MBO9543657.1 TonB-dependent receptor [Caulobacter sp.]